MTANSALWFVGPGQIEVRKEGLPKPGSGEALITVHCSAISAGTEMLLYRGQLPKQTHTDKHDTISDGLRYPTKYGYSAVGEVTRVGKGVGKEWIGRAVFAFNPHESHCVLPVSALKPLPENVGAEDAVFLANMETAVNLLQDGKPMLGERVAIIGQGVVGLLSTALAAYFPLAQLVAIDPFAMRREAALSLGAHAAYSPDDLPDEFDGQFDLIFELSGNPAAIDIAIRLARFNARVVLGSWYGDKAAPIDLGGAFHRNRIQLISSQVSTIAPELGGRWDKDRRFDLAWEMLGRIKPARLITGRFPLSDAATAYQTLADQPAEHIQLIFTY